MAHVIQISESDIDLFVHTPAWASPTFLEKKSELRQASWPDPELAQLWVSRPLEADLFVANHYGAQDRYLWFLEHHHLRAGWRLVAVSRERLPRVHKGTLRLG